MTKTLNIKTILAIDLGLEYIGFTVFVGKELVRYGVKNLKGPSISEDSFTKGKSVINALIKKSSPHVVVLEKPSHKERKKNRDLRKLITHAKSYARVHDAKVYEFDPCVAREQVFSERKATKKNVAEVIASRYPELSAYVPATRRLVWTRKEHYWLNVFDACTLALAYLGTKKK